MLLHKKLLCLLAFSFIKSISEDCMKDEHTCKRSTRVPSPHRLYQHIYVFVPPSPACN